MSEGPSRKLPKTTGITRPGPDERVRWKGGADLQNGWWGRHGTLFLTDERLVFIPTLLDGLLGGRRHEMPLDRITEVERWPLTPGEIPPGGKRPRMRIHTAECAYELMAGDIDAWISALEKIYMLREKRGVTYRPTFRHGVDLDNLMLAED